MKKILAMLLVFVMVFGLVACSGEKKDATTTTGANSNTGVKPAEPKKITLTVWAPADVQSEEKPWLQEMEAAFQEKYKDYYTITWENVAVSEADAKNTVLTDVTAAADVYMFANDQLGELVEAKALVPLSGNPLKQIQEGASETMLNSVTYKNEVYGVPYTGNTWWLYYDKSVFTDADIKSLEAMLAKGKVAFRLANSWYTQAFYLANGCSMFGPSCNDASAGFDFGGDKAVAVTNYLIDLVQNPNFVFDDDKSGLAGIQDGSVKAFVSGDWEAQQVKDALGENFGAAQLPTIKIDGAEKQLRAFAGSKAIGVNPNADDLVAAQLLAAFLGSADAQLARYQKCGTIPCDASLADKIATDPVAVAQLNTLNYTAYVQPTIPEMGVWWSYASALANEIVAGTVTHENAAEKTNAFNDMLNAEA